MAHPYGQMAERDPFLIASSRQTPAHPERLLYLLQEVLEFDEVSNTDNDENLLLVARP